MPGVGLIDGRWILARDCMGELARTKLAEDDRRGYRMAAGAQRSTGPVGPTESVENRAADVFSGKWRKGHAKGGVESAGGGQQPDERVGFEVFHRDVAREVGAKLSRNCFGQPLIRSEHGFPLPRMRGTYPNIIITPVATDSAKLRVDRTKVRPRLPKLKLRSLPVDG